MKNKLWARSCALVSSRGTITQFPFVFEVYYKNICFHDPERKRVLEIGVFQGRATIISIKCEAKNPPGMVLLAACSYTQHPVGVLEALCHVRSVILPICHGSRNTVKSARTILDDIGNMFDDLADQLDAMLD